MKWVFSIMLFFAVSALSAEIVWDFVENTQKLASSAEDPDSDNLPQEDGEDQDDKEEEDKELKDKGFHWSFFYIERNDQYDFPVFVIIPHLEAFTEQPPVTSPFSPPELV